MANDINVNDLLTVAQKRQARKALSEWVADNINRELYNQAQAEAARWVAAHKKEIADAVSAEMPRVVDAAVKAAVSNALSALKRSWQ